MGRFTISASEEQMARALECLAEPPEEQQGHTQMPIVDSACPKCSWKKARRDPSACFFECCLCGERTSYEKRSGGYFVYDKTSWCKMEATDSVGTPICKDNESTGTAGTALVYINPQSVSMAVGGISSSSIKDVTWTTFTNVSVGDAVLAIAPDDLTLVDIPEWGATIEVRPMTARRD